MRPTIFRNASVTPGLLCAFAIACGGADATPVEPDPPVTDTPALTRTVVESGLSTPMGHRVRP